MDKGTHQMVSRRLEELIKKHAASDPVLRNYAITRSGGTYDPRGDASTMKFLVMPLTQAPPTTGAFGTPLDDQAVKMGLAKGGTPIKYIDLNGQWAYGVVVRARRTKYEFTNSAGQLRIIAFRACFLAKPPAPASPAPAPNAAATTTVTATVQPLIGGAA